MKVQLNRVSFGLPTKAFFIDYTVSQKRQLPVVKEFIIRVLHSIGNSPVSLIQSYFGFTAAETQAVLDDLIEESLIKWNDDEIELTNHALENFEEVEGNMLPRFFEVVDKTDTVFFELSEFRMLPKTVQRSGLSSTSISLSLPDDCFEKLNDKARSAFDSNFEHFREAVKGEDTYSDREELYKINHVNSKYDIGIPIPVEYYIDTNAPNVLQTAYESTALDEWDTSKSLFNYMDTAISSKNDSNSAKDFSDYLSVTDDPILINYWDENRDRLNTELLLKHYEVGTANQSKDTQLIVGNLYTDFNSDAIFEQLKELFKQKPKSSGLIWLTKADNGTWGRTKELGSLVDSIVDLFDKRKKTSEAVLVIPCSSKQESYNQRKIYCNIDAKLMDCEKRFGGDSCEVLLIPNIMVACLHHLPLSDNRNISLPVGYVSFAPKFIESVTQNILKWATSETKFNHYFELNHTEIHDTVLNKHFSQILSQGQDINV
ncbi:hypothetical protein [Xenorhabdus bovienii]|uniref:hypothetical protein n=1 Tax=Xenorhabdus bovienii TaxID=40576 RepID=UPI0004DA3272|nr:hypothetical protein [Xenorhabdus bovienii]CDG89903.1 conserved hypothetical protein [Xenorhabdus bovienii str. feltiae France]CDG92148.1 conserved hypothetical protein [Xenorhabdus bovienii str. feltiae Florida]